MSKWISVDEQLPEDGVIALIAHFINGKGTLIKHVNGYHVWFAQRRNNRWERADGMSQDPVFHANVTHWMPLPEPPKGNV